MTQKFADYSDVTSAGQIDAMLRAGAFNGIAHYIAGNNARRRELPSVVQAVRQLGWPQMGISVPTIGFVNGAQDAEIASNDYRMPAGAIIWLDIEPTEFDSAPNAWPTEADRWCDGIRAGGYSPGIYGVDRTVAACSNHADRIWRAKPGECDPAAEGLDSAFFAGKRAIQCAQVTIAGLTVDVSYSEFSIEVLDMATLEDILTSVQATQREVGYVTDQSDPNYGKITPNGVADVALSGIRALQQQIAALARPNIDVSALVTELTSNQQLIDAIASAVAHKVGAALDKA